MINILFNTKDKRKTPVFFDFTLYENLDDVKKLKIRIIYGKTMVLLIK